ncbi:MAG: HAD-IIIC family phosphatase [Candidatus Cloacimonetes bacterium]|nr:HAD-IIIC family phosphatase [Candidatus Cloacimonadota bacterium]
MAYYIVRNYTVEHLFDGEHSFSHYNAYDPDEINNSTHDMAICFLMPLLSGNYEDRVSAMNALIQALKLLLSQVKKKMILFSMPLAGGFRALSDTRLNRLIIEYNQLCYAAAEKHGFICFDFAEFARGIPSAEFTDWKHYYLSQIALNPKYTKQFTAWFEAQMDALDAKRRKCIVVDLDNTLWGGVIGEDGIEGIKIGGGYPGVVFQEVQRLLLSAYENGVILAICSKNNEIDALVAINEHPNMILKEQHFAIKYINWRTKAENLSNIAKSLNIGLDSMVFIDDNPSERALVRSLLPEVLVPDFPEKLYQYPSFMEDVLKRYFSLYNLTDEDKKKTEQYLQNMKREQFQKDFSDYDRYLEELEICLEMSLIEEIDLPRVAQLTQKTNQFNLSTKRYTEYDLNSLIRSGNLIYVARVKDKFGEYGLTGVAILIIEGATATIDSLLMSCRVIGRKVENEFLHQIICALKEKGIRSITASYQRTQKNPMVKDFYDKAGFELLNSSSDLKEYALNVDFYQKESENIVKVTRKNER